MKNNKQQRPLTVNTTNLNEAKQFQVDLSLVRRLRGFALQIERTEEEVATFTNADAARDFAKKSGLQIV